MSTFVADSVAAAGSCRQRPADLPEAHGSDHLAFGQRREPRGIEAEPLAQHLVRVLAGHWWWQTVLRCGAREAYRIGNYVHDLWRGRMRYANDDLARPNMRIGKDLLERVD